MGTVTTTSEPSPSVPHSWTDDPLQQNVTKVKAVHTEELRSALEALPGHTHTALGVTTGAGPANSVVWTDDPVVANTTKIKAAHLNELVASVKEQDNHRHSYAKSVADYTYSDWTSYYDPVMTFTQDPATTSDKPTEDCYTELRTYLAAFAHHTHTVECTCECQCTCTCQCQCTCTCQCTCDSKTT